MSRKIFDDMIRKKAARGMKAWPSKELILGPWEMLGKRLAKGIRLTRPLDQTPDPVYEATSSALSKDRARKVIDHG